MSPVHIDLHRRSIAVARARSAAGRARTEVRSVIRSCAQLKWSRTVLDRAFCRCSYLADATMFDRTYSHPEHDGRDRGANG